MRGAPVLQLTPATRGYPSRNSDVRVTSVEHNTPPNQPPADDVLKQTQYIQTASSKRNTPSKAPPFAAVVRDPARPARQVHVGGIAPGCSGASLKAVYNISLSSVETKQGQPGVNLHRPTQG